MIKELDTVALARDIPEHGLKAGDLGAVVLVHENTHAVEYEIEFVALDGRTLALLTLPAEAVRSVRPREIPHARVVADAAQ